MVVSQGTGIVQKGLILSGESISLRQLAAWHQIHFLKGRTPSLFLRVRV